MNKAEAWVLQQTGPGALTAMADQEKEEEGSMEGEAAARSEFMCKTPRWIQGLREVIKAQHGMNWYICEQSGRVKLTRRWPDGVRHSVVLRLPWHPDYCQAVISQITSIRQRMEADGVSLHAAAVAESLAGDSSAHEEGWKPAPQISEPPGECRKSGGELEKPRWDLLPLAEVEEIIQVLSFGARKYGAHNWKRGARWGRYFAALQRHLVAWWMGQEKDPETGLSHLAHAGCCLLFLMAYSRHGWGSDDRCSGPDGETLVKGDGL